MTENSKHFVLAYSSPLLCQNVLEKVGMLGKKEASQALINKSIMIPEASLVLSEFLQLLYQPNLYSIDHHISTEQ